jgi:hypothetical protein
MKKRKKMPIPRPYSRVVPEPKLSPVAQQRVDEAMRAYDEKQEAKAERASARRAQLDGTTLSGRMRRRLCLVLSFAASVLAADLVVRSVRAFYDDDTDPHRWLAIGSYLPFIVLFGWLALVLARARKL